MDDDREATQLRVGDGLIDEDAGLNGWLHHLRTDG
jgi:hypothetical protein